MRHRLRNACSRALAHLEDRRTDEAGDSVRRDLHRIFFYDCPPLSKKLHHPLSGRAIDLAKSPEATFGRDLHDAVVRLRKVALRRGRMSEIGQWALRPEPLRKLLRGDININDLNESDVFFDCRQKGVDMRIAIDIASLAYRRHVNQIVLFAGDADLVPAAKLARREGIDFILDPMWGSIANDLHEHIDGLRSTCPRPVLQASAATGKV